MPLARIYRTETVAITNDIGTCGVINMQNASGLAVLVPTGVTSLTYYACATTDGTYVIVDNLGTAGVSTVTAAKWFTCPADIFPYPFVKLLGNAAGGSTTACVKQ